MHLSQVSLLLATIHSALSVAVPSKTHVVHEKRGLDIGDKWVQGDRVASHVKLPVRVGLKQNAEALEKAPEWLMDVSHPESPRYGMHWTSEDIVEAFKPSSDSVDAVRDWIAETIDVQKQRITHSDNKAWLAFDATAAQLESLVRTRFHEHHHEGYVAGRQCLGRC